MSGMRTGFLISKLAEKFPDNFRAFDIPVLLADDRLVQRFVIPNFFVRSFAKVDKNPTSSATGFSTASDRQSFQPSFPLVPGIPSGTTRRKLSRLAGTRNLPAPLNCRRDCCCLICRAHRDPEPRRLHHRGFFPAFDLCFDRPIKKLPAKKREKQLSSSVHCSENDSHSFVIVNALQLQ